MSSSSSSSPRKRVRHDADAPSAWYTVSSDDNINGADLQPEALLAADGTPTKKRAQQEQRNCVNAKAGRPVKDHSHEDNIKSAEDSELDALRHTNRLVVRYDPQPASLPDQQAPLQPATSPVSSTAQAASPGLTDSLSLEVQELKERIIALGSDLASLETRLETREADVATLQKRVKSLVEGQASSFEEMATLQKRVKSLVEGQASSFEEMATLQKQFKEEEVFREAATLSTAGNVVRTAIVSYAAGTRPVPPAQAHFFDVSTIRHPASQVVSIRSLLVTAETVGSPTCSFFGTKEQRELFVVVVLDLTGVNFDDPSRPVMSDQWGLTTSELDALLVPPADDLDP